MNWRFLGNATALMMLGVLVAAVAIGLLHPDGRIAQGIAHPDYATYMSATRDWLAGSGFYEPYQLAGPYPVVAAEILYPPPILLLLAPFTFLPPILWWAIPIVVTAYVVASYRPTGFRLALILGCLATPWSLDIVANGNPALWMLMFLAIGTRVPGVAALVLMKTTLAPFALVGIRSRLWWALTGLLVATTLVLWPLTVEYVAVLRNAQWPGGNPLYSLTGTFLMLVPLIASYLASGGPRVTEKEAPDVTSTSSSAVAPSALRVTVTVTDPTV